MSGKSSTRVPKRIFLILAGSETVRWGGAMPDAGTAQQLRFTAIWKKLPRGWQQIARHANVIHP